MHKRTFNRSISIFLIFIVAFFAVYVAPMPKVEAFAITASLMLGAAALLTATGIYALNADAMNDACVALLNRIFNTSTYAWDSFNTMCAANAIVMTSVLSDIFGTFKWDLFGGDVALITSTTYSTLNTLGGALPVDSCFDWSDIKVTYNSQGSFSFAFKNSLVDYPRYLMWFNPVSDKLSNFTVSKIYSSSTTTTLNYWSGTFPFTAINRIYFDTTWKIGFNNGTADYDTTIAVPYIGSSYLTDGRTVFTGEINDFYPLPAENYDFDDGVSPDKIIGKMINPTKIINSDSSSIAVTTPEEYINRTYENIDVIGTVINPTEEYVRDDLPLYSIAALTASGIAFNSANALKDYYFTSKALQKYYDVLDEASKVVEGLPTIVSWKYYPNGIPPDKPPDKPPKWNPFKLPTEPPWKACKEIMVYMAWHVVQFVKDKLFTTTGDNVTVNPDIVGITEDGDIVYNNNDNVKNNITGYPYYKFNGHEFTAIPDVGGTTSIFKDGVFLEVVVSSGSGLYEGFIVIKDGVDTVLKYISQTSSSTTQEIECDRIVKGILDVYDVTGSTASVVDSPTQTPQEVVLEPSIDEQLEIGQAEVITSPEDNTYEYLTAIQEQTGTLVASLSKWFTKTIEAVKTGFNNIGNMMNPPTNISTNFNDPDPNNPTNKGNPFTLIFVFWKLLLACIGLISRFGVFIATLINIPAMSEYVNEYIIQGIEFGRNISVFGLFTIWSAFQSVLTAIYAFYVVSIVNKNWRSL